MVSRRPHTIASREGRLRRPDLIAGGFGNPPRVPITIDPYPRNRAAVVRSFVGRKVTVSTTDFHYLVGRLVALGDDDTLVFHVRGQEVRLRRSGLATIQAADDAVAEYVK